MSSGMIITSTTARKTSVAHEVKGAAHEAEHGPLELALLRPRHQSHLAEHDRAPLGDDPECSDSSTIEPT